MANRKPESRDLPNRERVWVLDQLDRGFVHENGAIHAIDLSKSANSLGNHLGERTAVEEVEFWRREALTRLNSAQLPTSAQKGGLGRRLLSTGKTVVQSREFVAAELVDSIDLVLKNKRKNVSQTVRFATALLNFKVLYEINELVVQGITVSKNLDKGRPKLSERAAKKRQLARAAVIELFWSSPIRKMERANTVAKEIMPDLVKAYIAAELIQSSEDIRVSTIRGYIKAMFKITRSRVK